MLVSLRKHQQECLECIDKRLNTKLQTKGLVKMFCGSGKSLIIYKTLLKYGLLLSVVVVPSINLITQFNKDYLTNDNNTKFSLITICSKNELPNNNLIFTTNEDEIVDFLKNIGNKIVLITYQSLPTFITIIASQKIMIDLICFDEAHHILGDGMKKLLFGDDNDNDFDDNDFDDNDFDDNDFDDNDNDNDDNDNDDNDNDDNDNDFDDYNILNNNLANNNVLNNNLANNNVLNNNIEPTNFIKNHVNKTLFFTATPKNANGIKMYENVLGYELNEGYCEIEDDENENIYSKNPHCGDIIYEYNHIDGVKDGVLNDFNIRIDLFTNKKIINKNDANNNVLANDVVNNNVLANNVVNNNVLVNNVVNNNVLANNIVDNNVLANNVLANNIVDNNVLANNVVNNNVLANNVVNNNNNVLANNVLVNNVVNNNVLAINVVDNNVLANNVVNNNVLANNVVNNNVLAINVVDNNVLANTENNIKILEAIYRTVLETGNNRILTFHARSEVIKIGKSDVITFSSFTDIVLLETYERVKLEFKDKIFPYNKLKINNIIGSTKNKLQIIEEFDKTSNNEISILCSCKCLSEGIDTKNANMCVFVDSKNSYVDIIQNIGRVCRKTILTKQLSTILIPVCVDVDKYKDCDTDEKRDLVIRSEMSKTGDFSGILNVLSALRQEDNLLFEMCLRYPNIFAEKEIKNNLEKHNLRLEDKIVSKLQLFIDFGLVYDEKLSEKENFVKLSNKTQLNFQIITNIIDNPDFIVGNFATTIFFVKDGDSYKRAVEIFADDAGKRVKVVGKTNRRAKAFVHINDDLKVFWSIDKKFNENNAIFGGFIKANVVYKGEEHWFEQFEKVKEYIKIHGKRPRQHDKNKDTNILAEWLSTQIDSYKRNGGIITLNKKIRTIWEKFKNEHKELFFSLNDKWKIMLQKCIDYIEINNKLPSSTCIYDKKIKNMGLWIRQNKVYLINKQHVFKDENYVLLFKQFQFKYKHLFLNSSERWNEKLQNVANYILTNGYAPTQSKKNDDATIILARWFDIQVISHVKKINIMQNNEVYDTFTKFLITYKNYIIDEDTKWKNMLNQIDEYITVYKKRPPISDDNFKSMNMWLAHNLRLYRNLTNQVENKEKHELFTIFINKHRNIFMSGVEIWIGKLNYFENYIKIHNKKPTATNDKEEIKSITIWFHRQTSNYKKKFEILKNPEIRMLFAKSLIKHRKYYPDVNIDYNDLISNSLENIAKSITFKNYDEKIKEIKTILLNERSSTTKLLNKLSNNSPFNKITSYLNQLETNTTIIDFGCSNNELKQHYITTPNYNIIGYDTLNHDMQTFPIMQNMVDIIIFNNVLYKDRWTKFITDALLSLKTNGIIIFNENRENCEIITQIILEKQLKIKHIDKNELDVYFFMIVSKS